MQGLNARDPDWDVKNGQVGGACYVEVQKALLWVTGKNANHRTQLPGALFEPNFQTDGYLQKQIRYVMSCEADRL